MPRLYDFEEVATLDPSRTRKPVDDGKTFTGRSRSAPRTRGPDVVKKPDLSTVESIRTQLMLDFKGLDLSKIKFEEPSIIAKPRSAKKPKSAMVDGLRKMDAVSTFTATKQPALSPAMEINFQTNEGSSVQFEKKNLVDDSISTRWLSWIASQCPAICREGQIISNDLQLEDLLRSGLLIYELVKRVLPSPLGLEGNSASLSPKKPGPILASRSPRTSTQERVTTPRGVADHSKRQPKGARDSSSSSAAAARSPRAADVAAARSLWVLRAERGEVGWGGFAGRRNADGGLRFLIERMPDVGRHLPSADMLEARATRACRQVTGGWRGGGGPLARCL
jgi:hypothetical protein